MYRLGEKHLADGEMEGGHEVEPPTMVELMAMLVSVKSLNQNQGLVMEEMRREINTMRLERDHVVSEVKREVSTVKLDFEQYMRDQCAIMKKEIKEELEEPLQEENRQRGSGGSPPATSCAGWGYPGATSGGGGQTGLMSPLAAPPHAPAPPPGPASPVSPAAAHGLSAFSAAALPRASPKRRVPQDFEGRVSWVAYIAQFEMMAVAQGWSEAEKALQLVSCLKGPAVEVLSQLTPTQRASYASVVGALERRYGHQHQEEVFRARFRGRVRARGESLQHLAQDLERLVRQAYPTAPEELTTVLGRDQFIDALVDPQLKISVKQARATNLQEALAHALEFEAMLLTSGVRPAGSAGPTGRQDHRARRTRQAEGDEGAFLGKCWACGERGHRRGDCPRPPPRREVGGRQRGRRRTRSLGSGRSSPRPSCCWSCGGAGHYFRSCPNPRPVATATGAGNVSALGEGATPQPPPPSRPHSR